MTKVNEVMNNINDYPSCIKVPGTKQNTLTSNGQQCDVEDVLLLNSKLVTLANEVFGEGQWSHSVTTQTLDFVDLIMGKYIAGCTAFVKIQLKDGTFHEDIGYSNAEGVTKGLTVYYAKVASVTNAFKKVLTCFGEKLEKRIQKIIDKVNVSPHNNSHKHLYHSVSNQQMIIPERSTSPTSILKPSVDKLKEKKVLELPSVRDESHDQKIQNLVETNKLDNQKEQVQNEVSASEELLRLERKRKQLEKQMEYKRLMKEKEAQEKMKEKNINKPNTRY